MPLKYRKQYSLPQIMSFSGCSKKTTINHFDRLRSPPASPSGSSVAINRSHESVFQNSGSEKSLFFKKSFLRKNSDKKMKTTPDSSPKSTLTKQSRRKSKSEISLNEFLSNLQNNEDNVSSFEMYLCDFQFHFDVKYPPITFSERI